MNKKYHSKYILFFLIFIIIWSLTLTASLIWNLFHFRKMVLEMATHEARISLEKDMVYRDLIIRNQPVYVGVSEETPSNPFLSHIPERDIITPSGEKLTLMPSAYMIKKLYNLTLKSPNHYINIVSLNPLNPKNYPDSWEKLAIKKFDSGVNEISSIEKIREKEFIRLIRPLKVKKDCLKCHKQKGLKEEDILGAISVGINIEPFRELVRPQINKVIMAHVFIWAVIFFSGIFALLKIYKAEKIRRNAEEVLIKSHEELERKVIERTRELTFANESLIREMEERKILEAEALRLWSVIQQTGDIIFITNKDGIIEYVNPSFEKITGYSKEEAVGNTPRILKSGLMSNEYYREFYEKIFSGRIFQSNVIDRKKNGEIFYYDQTITPIKDQNGKITHFISTGKDVTEHKRFEEKLKESEAWLIEVQNIAHLGSWEYNIQTNELRLSDEAKIIFNKDSNYYKNNYLLLIENIHPEDRDSVEKTWRDSIEKGKPYDIGYRILRNNNGIRFVHERGKTFFDKDGKAIRFVVTLHDITERKMLEEQLIQSQKMEAIGRLAGGIAHDFNNILTVIKGYCDLSLIEVKEGILRENLIQIKDASNKASDLVHKILAFSRRQVMEMKVIDVNSILNEMDKMLRRLIGEDIELITIFSDNIGKVKADPGQIEQIIMNLVINAKDAMPMGGRLIIETANVELDETYTKTHFGVEAGKYVMISVSDTGVGMSPEIMQHIFEPFFTTKEKGKGTGLGLSTVYGIVKQSGGTICVYSEPGQGTTFKIYLPMVEGEVKNTDDKIIKEEIEQGTETILIIEDNENVRKLAVQILGKQGYKVLEAHDGSEALMICKDYEETLHLILVDLVMPSLNGRQVIEELSKVRKDFKVLYMSGYPENTYAHHGILEPEIEFIKKPFTMEELARKVRCVLNK